MSSMPWREAPDSLAAKAAISGTPLMRRRRLNTSKAFAAIRPPETQTEKFENLVKAGVIDPTKVVRSALQHAASIASLLLTMEAVIMPPPGIAASMFFSGICVMGAGMY